MSSSGSGAEPEAKPKLKIPGPVRQLVILIAVIALSILALSIGWRRMVNPSREPTRTWIDKTSYIAPGFPERCGVGKDQPSLLVVTSPEKGDWVEIAAATFMKDCSHTSIRVERHEDLAAIRLIEGGELEPNLWLPTDNMFADILEGGWVVEQQEGELGRGPSLMRMPVVLFGWSERLDALEQLWPEAENSPFFVSELVCPGIPVIEGEHPKLPTHWDRWTGPDLESPPAIASALEGWGPVRIGIGEPTDSASGFAALLATAHGYFIRRGLTSAEIGIDTQSFEHAIEHGVEFEDWLRACQAQHDNVSPLDSVDMARSMYQLGPDYNDAVLVYEHDILEILLDDPRTRIMYPQAMHLADHPVVVFPGEWRSNAELFQTFLFSDAMQREAFLLGFRPTRTGRTFLELATELRESPLARGISRGVKVPKRRKAAQPARLGRDPMFVLRDTWSSVTGSY